MSLKQKVYKIIFESNTPLGKWFDILLIISILISVGVVMLDSVRDIHEIHGPLLNMLEWIFTFVFTIEFMLRIYSAKNPIKYSLSFFGIVDIVSIAPTYLSIFIPGTHILTVIRILRVLRVFRILKFVQFIAEAKVLVNSVKRSARKITVFIFAVFTIVVILGSLMYIIEVRPMDSRASSKYLLGHCDLNNCWVWGYITINQYWPGIGQFNYDFGI